MKNASLALAAVLLLQSATGCCLCRKIFPRRTVVGPAAACAPAPTCCPSSDCCDTGCDCCSSGAPMGGYMEPGIQYAPSSSSMPLSYGNGAPLPPGP